MSFNTWLLFLAMETALSLSPGPAVFYVVSQGVRGALRRTLPAAAGILTANGIYFALSATSLGAIIAAMPMVMEELETATAQRLVQIVSIESRRRFEITDPRRTPPSPYWPR